MLALGGLVGIDLRCKRAQANRVNNNNNNIASRTTYGPKYPNYDEVVRTLNYLMKSCVG